MTLEFNAGGKTTEIQRRGSELWRDGRRIDVDAVQAGNGWSLLIGRRSYEVTLIERRPGDLIVSVNGTPIHIRGGVRRFASRTSTLGAGAAPTRAQRVVAPMPGRVARVLVTVGEAVAARQGLVVVEAMKMENELRSPRAGTVAEVRATEGALVEANAILIVLE